MIEEKIPDWHTRGYLPHAENRHIQMITFRLYDSLPKEIIDRWKLDLDFHNEKDNDKALIQLQELIDQYEDKGYGQCFLKDERIAEILTNTLKYDDGKRYRLIRWCIMPNHVHIIAEIIKGHELSNIVKSWKSFTSHKANALLNRHGSFWMQEYYDRFIRDYDHLINAVNYVDFNPVKAGLAKRPEDWRWSSVGEGWDANL